jgi:thioredoxin-related protein
MKTNIVLLSAVAVLICITTPACSSESSTQSTAVQSQTEETGIQWYGYDEGMALGKKEGKKILLHFYANWCSYCKKMEKEIFADSESAAFINQNFVPIRINSDDEAQLATSYSVSGLPTTYFMDKDGNPLQVLPGYLPKKMFMALVKFIQTDSYQKMTFSEYMGME